MVRLDEEVYRGVELESVELDDWVVEGEAEVALLACDELDETSLEEVEEVESAEVEFVEVVEFVLVPLMARTCVSAPLGRLAKAPEGKVVRRTRKRTVAKSMTITEEQ